MKLSEICGDGHPLLLKLSANWLKKTAESQLNEDDFTFFERLFQRDELGNAETQVGEVFELLLNELTAQLRTLLLEVSVYRVPFNLARAQAMQSEMMAADLDSLEALGFLIGQEDRWQLHPLMKEPVTKALREEGLEEEAHGRAIAYFEARLQAEETDIQDYLECFHHYCERQEFEAAYDVIDRCFSWLNLSGSYRTLVDLYGRLAEVWHQETLPEEKEINKLGWTLTRLGNAYDSLGDYRQAIDFQQQSLEITREIGDRNGEAISLLNLGHAYAKIDEHWKSRDSYEQAKAIFTNLQLSHRVEKCEKAIQERNRIISLTPKKAPALPTQNTEPDWREKSMPAATPTRSTSASPKRQSSLPKWLPYLAVAAAVLLLVLLLQ